MRSSLSAERLQCGDNVLDFKKSKLGTNFKSRVRVISGNEDTLKDCQGVM